MSEQILLAVRDARKSYRGRPALRGASFELRDGELLGFLGPNGAGKTTMISCLAGRRRLDGGEIRFGSGLGRHHVGLVPQTLAVYDDLTAEQNLRVFARLYGVARQYVDEQVEQALVWINLWERRRHLVREFSGGMQRRLNIACGVLHQPRILLLDEPTVGVDPQSRERIYEMLEELRDTGTAILLTTHQLDEAQYRCDRVAIVDHGTVIQCAPLPELIRTTVGESQHLQVVLSRRLVHVPPGMEEDSSGTVLSCHVQDPSRELPQILYRLQAVGAQVDSVELARPTLQDVFLHLTGRELRE